MKEKRKTKRISVNSLAWFIGEREEAEGIVQDLNVSGARVFTEVAFQIGDAVKIRVELPEGHGSFLTLARVIWRTRAKNHPYPHTMGMAFIDIGKNESARLKAFITAYGEIPVRIPLRGDSAGSSVGGDLAGGMTAATLALPEAMAYGTIVFAPLGPDYVALGLVAGLIALCFSNLGAAAYSGVRIMNNGPYSLSSLMLASSVTIIASKVPTGSPSVIMGLLFLVVFLCGFFQVVFGLVKFGEIVKYIPYPVTSGLLNGTAIVIFLGQVRPMLGLSGTNSLLDVYSLQPLTLLVGLVTIVTILHGSKLTSKIPASFLGIAAGTLIYYALALSGLGNHLGSVVGIIPFTIPLPKYLTDFWGLLFSETLSEILPELTSLAAGIAIVASLQSLIASVSADNLLKERSNTNRELIGQGLGNMASSLFGGIVSAGSQSRATANFIYGGRTAHSRLASGAFALFVLVAISPLVGKLPTVVLAGTLVALAFKAFDSWSFSLISALFSKEAKIKQLLSDLCIVVLVTATMVVVGVFEAVGIGILISVVLFVFRMGKDVVRRKYNGRRIRSHVQRPREEIDYLERHGNRIVVFELEGSLFFGTADKVAKVIDDVIETETDYIIVDLRHVSDIDSTGANILSRTSDRCREKERHMVLSSVNLMKRGDALCTLLAISEGRCEEERRCQCFETVDDALGWAEDRILDEQFGKDRYDKELSLVKLDVFRGFSESESDILRRYLIKVVYLAGDTVFEQGTAGDGVYFLVQGRAQIVIDLPKGGGKRKIAILCCGTIFGEMAIIDEGLRSSHVLAETPITCYYLKNSELMRLHKEQPGLSHRLLKGLARELSKRIRIANRAATELKA